MTAIVDLSDKRILITGGARGLGRAFAEAAHGAGSNLVIADILEDVGRIAASELPGTNFLTLDLADPNSVIRCMEDTISALGGLDGLVNCGAVATGIGGPSMTEIDIETWDRVMTVNVRGTWLMSRAAVPHLEAAGGGKIVNIASDTALWGAPALMHYVASKGAVISMTRSMARELGDKGIAVNSVAPGLTLVGATEYVPDERKQNYINGRAMSRPQRPDDVTGAVLFLLSDGASFITGQCLPVNGGYVLN